jgi:iron complex transport system substrate-binding protein
MTSLIRALAMLAALLFALPAFAEAFPVTIKHAFGETVIPSAPKRIVTWGWSSTDAAIALGVVPVGSPTFRSEGFDKDVTPWIEEALAKLGAPAPAILDDSVSPPIEQIAVLKPDLILAVYWVSPRTSTSC